ncbi:MAG: Uma2 family endonuclease [Geitlerinemataceae cyanobacterium]
MTAITLNLEPITQLTHEQFYELCLVNQDVAMERSPQGELIIMSPVGGGSGYQEARLIAKLYNWHEETGLGVVFSSSTVFKLPNGGDRSPDAAWVSQASWDALTPEQQEKFPPLCPEFVIELRSKSDRLVPLQQKMQEYLGSGLKLGWLVNPQDRTVEIYRAGRDVETLELSTTVSGEDVLPGFELELKA